MNQILFLCTGNYYRSRFAEELFNHLAQSRAPDWRAVSKALAIERGHANVGAMSRWTLEGLAARGVTPLGAQRMPAPCTLADLEAAKLVIAVKEAEHRPLLAQRYAPWSGTPRYWHVHDVEDAPADQALDQLDRLVRDLVAELAGMRPG